MVRAFPFALRSCVIFAGLALCAAGAYAEQPTRAARLVSSDGTTQIFGAGESKDQASDVQANMPLLEGTQLRTAEDGRAEIEFEDGSIARVTPNSQVSLDSLSEKETVIGVVQGLVYFELRGDSARPYSVRYGSSLVRLVTDSTFRVNLDVSPGELSVFAGEVVAANGDKKVIVHASESLRFDAEASEPYVLASGITPDSWDQWNDEQDAQAATANAQQSDVASQQADGSSYGWSDLDAYGDWYPVQDAGVVWQPADAGADFDPYALGSWAWYPGFGYTWVSGYSWGWTPFHCGGWSYFDGFGWGWRPGTCYGWGTGLHYRRPPPGFRPPLKPIGPPTVIRLKHPVIPRTPGQPVVRAKEPVLPIHKTAPVILDGAVVLPLPRKPIVIHQDVGEGFDSPVLGNRIVITRGGYPPSQMTRSTVAPVVGTPLRANPPVRVNPPIVARPMPMPSPVHSSPSPVAPPSTPHIAAPPAGAAAVRNK